VPQTLLFVLQFDTPLSKHVLWTIKTTKGKKLGSASVTQAIPVCRQHECTVWRY